MGGDGPLGHPSELGQGTGSVTAEIHLGLADLGGPAVERRRRRKAPWVIAAVVLVAAGVAVAMADPFTSHRTSQRGVVDNSYPTSTVTVARRSLSSQTPVNATLGYAGGYSVVNQAPGTFTWLPAVGQVVSQGQVLYRVDGDPVALLYGSTPAYRGLTAGMTGTDVAELNADLVALGDATSDQLSPTSDYFGTATITALKKLQTALGVSDTGTLTLGQAVFSPTAVRVTTVSANLGGPAQAGQPVLQGTSTIRQVTIALDAAQQSEVKVGDKVTITLPDGSTTPGVVSSVGTVATTPSSSSGGSAASSGGLGSSTPTVTVEVTPTDPGATGSLDEAPVQVSITTVTVPAVLVVPVDALMSVSGGGYAVEVVDPDGVHHLVDVAVGIFDPADSLVQVTGSGLAAGQRVVVPAT